MTVQFTNDNRLVTGCGDNVIRAFDTNYSLIEDEAGSVRGKYAAENNGLKAVADGNAVKVVDNAGIILWQ